MHVQAEFESRCEMYEAQVTKMQRSLERGDTEKAKVEEDLAKAMALTAQGDRQASNLHPTCTAFWCLACSIRLTSFCAAVWTEIVSFAPVQLLSTHDAHVFSNASVLQGLAAMRDRLSMVVTGRGSKTSQLEDRLKVCSLQLRPYLLPLTNSSS